MKKGDEITVVYRDDVRRARVTMTVGSGTVFTFSLAGDGGHADPDVPNGTMVMEGEGTKWLRGWGPEIEAELRTIHTLDDETATAPGFKRINSTPPRRGYSR